MKLSLKWTAISVGGIIAIAHIGLLGYLIREQPERVVEVPTINIPHGPYSSYKIEAGKDGYSIEYHADDPKVLQSERSLDMNKERTGFFGGGREQRSEYRRDQYTREGTRNLGGEIGEVGKIGGVSAECIAADAGARSQGAMAGTSIAAGVIVPAVSSVPYIGWLAGGWALLLGQNIGSEAGSQVNSFISDC
tara:strand:+ start:285 stop:860 length:576 start_codon:yes stop_codon:yes gene_type:complete